MATPLKVRFRKFMEELLCGHVYYIKRHRQCGFEDFVICECEKCGKVWVE